jgi:hypothetical protein
LTQHRVDGIGTVRQEQGLFCCRVSSRAFERHRTQGHSDLFVGKSAMSADLRLSRLWEAHRDIDIPTFLRSRRPRLSSWTSSSTGSIASLFGSDLETMAATAPRCFVLHEPLRRTYPRLQDITSTRYCSLLILRDSGTLDLPM